MSYDQNLEELPVKDKPTTNVPLSHQQMRDLIPVRQEGKPLKNGQPSFVPGLSHTTEFPTRRERRQHKVAVSSRNRATTAGRISQQVDITVKKETAWGPVNEPTGDVKKIVHHPVVMKVWRAMTMSGLWRKKDTDAKG